MKAIHSLEKLIEMINNYGPTKIDEVINHDNDYNFDYFAWRSLQEMYLLKLPNGKSSIPSFLNVHVLSE